MRSSFVTSSGLQQLRVRGHTWSEKAIECQRHLRNAGLVMQGMPEVVAVAAG